MIQRTFDVTSESELLWLADMKFYSDYTRAKTVFVQFYLSRFSAADAQKVLDVIRRELPNAKVIGMSLYGDPFVGLNAEKLMRFNFCFFDESEVTILDYDGDKMPMEEIVADFQKNLSRTKNARGVLLLGSGVTFKASQFMDAVTKGHEDIPFFGSIANINTADVDDQAPYAFGNNMVRNGIAAAIFSGKNLHFYSESLFSWNPIGKEMLVEAGAPGAPSIVGDSVIKKIDGAPAVQIYKKYLNVDPDAHFISNICEFPLVVNRNGYLMPRVPCGFNDEGELNTMGDVRDGEYIRFTYGKASEILSKSEEASHRMQDFAPEGIFLYVCANRAIFLKNCAHEEIEFYSRLAQDLVYCHGFSELYRYNGQGGVFNSQLVTIGLREGKPKEHTQRKQLIPGISFDNPRRGAHSFVHSHVHPDFESGHEPHTGGAHSAYERDNPPQSDSFLGGGDALLRSSEQPGGGNSAYERLRNAGDSAATRAVQGKNSAYDGLADLGNAANARTKTNGGHSSITEMFTHTGGLLEIPRKSGFRPESSAATAMASLPHSVMAELNRQKAEDFTQNMLRWGDSERERLEWAEATNSGRLSPNGDAPVQISDFQRSIGVSIPISERLVTFLEATTNELREATQKANAANEAKSNFLSNMSHEIRTPINAVLGLDEMILRESTEQSIKGYARDIQSSGRSLLSIINDILDFSKIEAGKMEIINADYDLRLVINDLANMIETRAMSKGLSFMVQIDETMPHLLHGDETRIKQCALNILTNAVKYTRTGSVTFTVGFEKIDETRIKLKLTVADTGIGIKEEDLPRLFKPFERIEENRNRSIEGTGLGMSIVNGLLTEMGTRLEVESTYGTGSTFSFAVEQTVKNWEKIGTREEALDALTKIATTYTESFQAPDAHVLVVDDTPMNLTVFKGLLKSTRIQIDTAPSGKDGLELARKNRYHLIFIDHLMPKMDGIEMLGELKADKKSKNQNTSCIALTANAVTGAKEMYLEKGFTDYLSKPIDSKMLEAMIAQHLPRELLALPGDKNFIPAAKQTWDGVERRGNVSVVNGIFADIFDLDIEAALKNCGDKEVFFQAAENFYDAIDEKSSQIEAFAAGGDWKNYTVLVHALKSSARLIGAAALSEKAKFLEECGDKAQKDDEAAQAEIKKLTPELLAEYRAYKLKIASLCKRGANLGSVQAARNGDNPTQAKPVLLLESKWKEALSVLKEAATAFDFDTADSIIAELEKFEIPSAFKSVYSEIKKAIRNADSARTLEILNKI